MVFLSNDPNANDPTRQCTCGYRRFRDTGVKSSSTVQRWALFDADAYGGMGSMPFGLFFGAGGLGEYGLFDATLNSCCVDRTCENCGRVRSREVVSSSTVFGSYVLGDKIYIVTSDVDQVGCFSVEFVGPGGTFSSPVDVSKQPILPLAAPAPAMTSPTIVEPSASVLLEAKFPVVFDDGDYVASFVDACCEVSFPLGTVPLEADVIVLNAEQADLNGAPAHWVTRNWRGLNDSTQVVSGAMKAIPFDKCDAVFEYDARFGTLPSSQGWTHMGTGIEGNYNVLPGGAMQGITVVDSYWEQSEVLSGAIDRIVSYAVFQVRANTDDTTIGAGLDLQGLYADGGAANYQGVRLNSTGTHWYTQLDDSARIETFEGDYLELGTANTQSIGPQALNENDWHYWAMQQVDAASAVHVTTIDKLHQSHQSLLLGTVATGPASPTMLSRFGDVIGGGADFLIRNLVVSGPGRFVRAWFRGFAPADSSVVRLALAADSTGSAKTARFRVRYGSMGTGGDPYAIPTNIVDLTVNFVTANQIIEAGFTCPSLTRGAPMWFTVERVHDHADDLTTATVFLFGATVRSV